jgi:hypothetical protein
MLRFGKVLLLFPGNGEVLAHFGLWLNLQSHASGLDESIEMVN